MTGSTWCKSEGCEVSKSLLTIEQTELYSLAIGVFLVLLIIGIKILKNGSEKLENLYKFGIFTMMICETILLGYLYFKSGTLCISCFVFYLLIIINFVMIGNSTKLLLIPFILVSLSLLDLNVSTASNKSLTAKYTLLQSEVCEHCKEIKKFLNENKITYIKEDYTLYSGLFSSLNITKIPLLLVKNNENNILILNGVSEIKTYINEYDFNKNTPIKRTSTQVISLQEKEGCELNFIKKDLENCEK
jgi:uncharacterized membrane protein